MSDVTVTTEAPTEVTTDPLTQITRDSTGTIAESLEPTSDSASQEQPGTPSLLNRKAEDKPADTKTDSPKPAAEQKAPDTYADYKVPEGFTLDAEVKTQADKLFKGMGLTQDQAQSLVDFYTSKTLEAHNAPFEAYKTMTDDWAEQSENHPDLRGKLAPGGEVNVRVAKLIDGLGDEALSRDFRNIMDITGAGNHPAFIRALDKIAQRMTEGTHVSGNSPHPKAGQFSEGTARQPSAAEAMYPHLTNRS